MDLSSAARSATAFFGSTLILSLISTSFLYIAYRIVYNLHFHPLAKHSGPLLGRITQWYDVYHAYIGDKHTNFHLLHERYGTVVRFSPNSLSINDPIALKAIYSHGANVQKSDFYVGFRAAPGAISTLLATEKAHHARKRRIMGQAFSDQAMRGLETYVLENIREWMGKLDSSVESARARGTKWGNELDMGKWNNYLVFGIDIMGDLVFGKSFGCLSQTPENRHAIHILGRAARRNYTVTAMPYLWRSGIEKYLPLLRGLWLDRQSYFAFAKAQVMQVMARNKSKSNCDGSTLETGDRKDIFSFLLTATDPESGEGLPMPELCMEGNTLIVAGSDTSSTTLSAALFYLVRNPPCLQRLTAEVRAAFTHEEDIRTGPALHSCLYLRACIDEAMRMSPAVAGLLPRVVLPGGLQIPALDLDIPAGVDAGVCTYAIQHHKDYVAEPFTYNPDRFLTGQPQKEVSDVHSAVPTATRMAHHTRTRSDSGISLRPQQRTHSPSPSKYKVPAPPATPTQDRDALLSVFCPFSLGHRACLGRPLVYMELSIALARMVWAFELQYVDKPASGWRVARDVKMGRRHESEYHTKDWFLGDNEGPWVRFAGREG